MTVHDGGHVASWGSDNSFGDFNLMEDRQLLSWWGAELAFLQTWTVKCACPYAEWPVYGLAGWFQRKNFSQARFLKQGVVQNQAFCTTCSHSLNLEKCELRVPGLDCYRENHDEPHKHRSSIIHPFWGSLLYSRIFRSPFTKPKRWGISWAGATMDPLLHSSNHQFEQQTKIVSLPASFKLLLVFMQHPILKSYTITMIHPSVAGMY